MSLNLFKKSDLHGMGVLIVVCSLIIQCGGSASSFSSSTTTNSQTDSNQQSTDTVIGGNVSNLTIADGSASMDLSGITESENVMMLLYSFNSNSTSSSFQISGSENEKVQLVSGYSFLMDEFDEDETESFHGHLRDEESYLEGDMVDSDSGSVRYAVSSPTVGSEETFKVLNSFSSSDSYDTVTATLRFQNEYFNIYVDKRNADSMTDDDISEVANNFAAVIPLEREVFGNESDVNDDGRFDILLTQTVNSLGGGSGMVTGFFYAIDLYPASTYAISNEKEVYFTFVPDPNGDYGSAVSKSFAMTNIYPGVFAHEYQHMISYNMHVNGNGGAAEEGWLNEGMSHLAEDIYSANDAGYFAETGLENPARVASFLASVNNTCITCGTSLKQRGGSYLLVRYLYEQAQQGQFSNVANGMEFLQNMENTSSRGVDNIVNVIYGSNAEDNAFKNLFGLFGLAVYLSNTDASSDARFQFTGINLRSSQDDNRGTVLNGPAIQTVSTFPFTDSLSGTTLSYEQASGAVVQSSGGTLQFNFSSNSNFGGYVIRE